MFKNLSKQNNEMKQNIYPIINSGFVKLAILPLYIELYPKKFVPVKCSFMTSIDVIR